MTDDHRIVRAGDSAVIVEFAERIDAAVNARAVRLAASLSAASIPGVRDVVPTFRTVAVYFDPLRTDVHALGDMLETAAGTPDAESIRLADPLRVPVAYGGEHGPDLADVAGFAGLAEADVVERHTATVYRVFMVGFVPGFAYMGVVDASIAAPRRATPRVRVPAGSVGIAGHQTAIYPADTPGGWQLIGRTSVRPFDASRRQPFLFKAGDAVRFYAVEDIR
jgi:KipI family sensor histidine kinase inhibitor